VRNSDSHILFIGRARFVTDDRYELVSSRHGRWTLKLRYAGAEDAGKYECQVSTVPKISRTFSLRVVGKVKVVYIIKVLLKQLLHTAFTYNGRILMRHNIRIFGSV